MVSFTGYFNHRILLKSLQPEAFSRLFEEPCLPLFNNLAVRADWE